jgi:hypothetical protein
MRFTADAHPGLASGAITLTFRPWTRPQAKVGGRYQVADVVLLVDDLQQVKVADITDADARRAGEADAQALVDRMARRPRGRYATNRPAPDVGPDSLVWRVAFHRVDPDPTPRLADQAELGDDAVADIARRLARLDRASPFGPWTAATLGLIADNPGLVSTKLAEQLGRDRPSFKVDVRKLKRLGLTESLEVGYRLSARGQAYLAHAAVDRPQQ